MKTVKYEIFIKFYKFFYFHHQKTKIWNISENDLDLEQTYRFAHLDEITGIASAPGTEHLFATCSLDKSLLLWDRQQTRPAIGINSSSNLAPDRSINQCLSITFIS